MLLYMYGVLTLSLMISLVSIFVSHYPERAFTLTFKDAAARFGHSDVVFDLFTETQFFI